MAEVPAPVFFFSPALFDTVRKTVSVYKFCLIDKAGFFPVVLLLVFFPGGFVHADEKQQAAHAEKLELLRERINVLKSELVSMRGQRDVLQDALEKAEKEIGVVAATLHGLDRQADRAHESIRDLQRDFDIEQGNLEKIRVTLEKELRVAYMTGKQEQIKLLLNQEEPAALGRLMVYHEYFMRARTQAMQSIRATLERLAGIERELVLQRNEIQGLIAQQQEKSARLLVKQAQRSEILAQLHDSLSSKTDQLAALEEDERRLQKLVESLQQAIRDIPPVVGEYESLPSLKGKLRWPVAGRISIQYGERHTSGKLRARGVHIASRAGADVHAIARGRVVFADWLRGFGLLMIIDHGDNYMSLYGQNRSLYREVGEWVGRDEVVAAAGNSGGQQKAGLYLELRKDGRPFNPGNWFQGKPEALSAEGRASR
jgi:septal ring factor EnvC (AmiA/AmiB activator)